jgi:hypothetical protein
MNCKKCAATLEQGDRFCRTCGTSLSHRAAVTSPQKPNKGLLILLICLGIVVVVSLARQNNDDDQKQVSSPVPIPYGLPRYEIPYNPGADAVIDDANRWFKQHPPTLGNSKGLDRATDRVIDSLGPETDCYDPYGEKDHCLY